MATCPDVRWESLGTIVLVTPYSDAATDWLYERVPDDAIWWKGSLIVEPRYIYDLVDDLRQQGFVCKPGPALRAA